MTAIEQRQFSRWAEDGLQSWLMALDYGCFLRHPVCAPGLPVVERFDWHGRPVEPGFRRVRVMARQAYVLCHAALGGRTDARANAEIAITALIDHGFGSEGQFYSRLFPDGTVLDATPDLYDISFGLFAMAWWYRLSGDERAIAVAERSLRHVRASLVSPSCRGFLARADEPGSHQQNPHMHLFEAANFLTAFTQRPVFKQLADEMFELAEEIMFDWTTGTMPEHFDDAWRPVRCGDAALVEPGHHYEWVWLLHRYARLAERPRAITMADRLFAFAQQHGHDEATGLVLDAVNQHGQPLATDLRIWPNTELLKAQVAMQECYGDGRGFDDAAITRTVQRVLDHFLTPQATGPAAVLREGWWIDHLEGQGLRPKSDHIPASSLYHIFFASTELLRHRAGHDPFSGLPW